MSNINYNDGRVHMEIYENDVDKKEIAKQFSEGDSKLYESLLQLWEKGIKTTSCCKGHENSPAYIGIVVDANSIEFIENICDYVETHDSKIGVNFSPRNDYDDFSIDLMDENTKNSFLEKIPYFINQKNNDKKTTIATYAIFLLNFARSTGFSFRLAADKNNIMFAFSEPGTIQVFNEQNAIPLEQILPMIKQNGNIPLVPFSCNNESMKEFLNIIYPGAFVLNDEFQK
ncbi:MAG: hypothetical protein E7170_00925 [Firmicutes bacterium]|nr:hypothetical protein [Bacillota bacterium]